MDCNKVKCFCIQITTAMTEIRHKVDSYITQKNAPVRDILSTLREIIVNVDDKITESIKWGMPHFEYNGIMCGMGGFKKHVNLYFHKGAGMSDPQNLFNGQDKNKSMRTVKFTRLDEVDPEVISTYIINAMKLNQSN